LTFLSWSSLIEYSDIHFDCLSFNSDTSWSHDLCFDKLISDCLRILYTSIIMYISLLIQSILEFFLHNQSIFNMTSYLIELRTSNVNFCESFNIMTLMWTCSVIHSDSSLTIYICIGFDAYHSVNSSILLLVAKYSCQLLLSLSLLKEVYFIQPEHQLISMIIAVLLRH
jgi:hypothetical protein